VPVILDLEFDFEVHLIGDVRDKPDALALDHDVVVCASGPWPQAGNQLNDVFTAASAPSRRPVTGLKRQRCDEHVAGAVAG
jgi:hypothetical protein